MRAGTVLDDAVRRKWDRKFTDAYARCIEYGRALGESDDFDDDTDSPELKHDESLHHCIETYGGFYDKHTSSAVRGDRISGRKRGEALKAFAPRSQPPPPPGPTVDHGTKDALSFAARLAATVAEWIHVDFEMITSPAKVSAMRFSPINGKLVQDDFLITDPRGFAHLLEVVAAPFISKVQLHQKVAAIEYSDTACTVRTHAGKVIKAAHCICTVPIGALQAKTITFVPPLKPPKLAAIDGVVMGDYAKVFAQFGTVFWNNDDEVLLIASEHGVDGFGWALNLNHAK